MIVTQTATTAFADCIGALGAGILLGVIYHILRFVTGNSKIATPIRDVLFAPVAALLSYSYAITFSFAGIMRWYILAFIGLGLIFYREVVLKPLYIKEKILKRQIVVTHGIAQKKLQHIVFLTKNKTISVAKELKISQNLLKKKLHTGYLLLYNLYTHNHFFIKRKNKLGKKKRNNKKKPTKQPAKAGGLLFGGIPNFSANTNPDTDKPKKGRG